MNKDETYKTYINDHLKTNMRSLQNWKKVLIKLFRVPHHNELVRGDDFRNSRQLCLILHVKRNTGYFSINSYIFIYGGQLCIEKQKKYKI